MCKRHAAVLPEGQQKVLGSKEEFLLGKLKKINKKNCQNASFFVGAECISGGHISINSS